MTTDAGPTSAATWRLHTTAADETRALGAAVGRAALPGTVVLLIGDLGAGKTVFAQGVARGLGTPGVVNSPTFVLCNEHLGGRLTLQHADLYRLTSLQEVEELALYDAAQDAVVLVEWPDRAEGALPPDHIVVEIEPGPPDGRPDDRDIALEATGPLSAAVLATARAEFD